MEAEEVTEADNGAGGGTNDWMAWSKEGWEAAEGGGGGGEAAIPLWAFNVECTLAWESLCNIDLVKPSERDALWSSEVPTCCADGCLE